MSLESPPRIVPRQRSGADGEPGASDDGAPLSVLAPVPSADRRAAGWTGRRRASRRVAHPVAVPVRPPGALAPSLLFWFDLVAATAATVAVAPRLLLLVFPLLWVTLVAVTGGYRNRALPIGARDLWVLVQIGLVLVLSVELTVGGHVRMRQALLVTGAVALIAGVLVRAVPRLLARRGAQGTRTVVLVGRERDVLHALDELDDPRRKLDVAAVCLSGKSRRTQLDLPTYLGPDAVLKAVAEHAPNAVLVLPSRRVTPDSLRRLSWCLEPTGTELLVSSGLLDVAPVRATVLWAGSLPVLHVRRAELRGATRVLKELWERAAAFLLLLVSFPVLAVLMLAIRAGSPGPAIFRQVRVGRGGRPFTMYKLRTMTTGAEALVGELAALNEADEVLFKVRSDPRVTPVGALLRRYSLDEVPQLWNVVRGEMALVGPRPALPQEVAAYDEPARRRMAVKPGLTGLWQVSGRSDLPWHQAIRLDLQYVDNWSLGLDLSIVARTARAVLSHRGAY